MSEIIVSVIIPTYKRSEDIVRAVDSCLNQTLKEIEVIVVDDNGIGTESGVKTCEMMRKYQKNPRVKYIQHEVNKNGSAARNTGIRVANGRFIAFLDDDDAFMPNRLKKISDKLKSLDSEWGACYTSYVKHQPNGIDQISNEKASGDVFAQTLMRSLYIGSGSNLFFRKSVVDDIGFFDESYKRNQDLEYLVRVTKKYKMAFVDEVLLEIFYDIRTVNMSYEESVKREEKFREDFSRYLQGFSAKEKKEIQIMYDLDWMRILLGKKLYGEFFTTVIKAKIPVYIYVDYIKYAIDRKKNKTSYGFLVKIK